MGSSHLYATSGYGAYNKVPRYDYIMVRVIDEHNIEIDQPAQLLAILEITYNRSVTTDDILTKYYLMVAYLRNDNIKLPDLPFQVLKWELINTGRHQSPNVCYIETSALQGPAHIVPNYRFKNHIISYYRTSNINDSFFHFPEISLTVMICRNLQLYRILMMI